MSTETYNDVHCTTTVHTHNKQHVHCVPNFLELIIAQNYTHGRRLCYKRRI